MATDTYTAIFIYPSTRDELKEVSAINGRTMKGQIECWIREERRKIAQRKERNTRVIQAN